MKDEERIALDQRLFMQRGTITELQGKYERLRAGDHSDVMEQLRQEKNKVKRVGRHHDHLYVTLNLEFERRKKLTALVTKLEDKLRADRWGPCPLADWLKTELDAILTA